MRARIDVSEIEAKTKIRAKYLRALENEEWSLLPGPTFVKSFLRTYATALGLDGKALVEEYRLHHEKPSESMLEPIVSSPSGGRGRGRSQPPGPSRAYMIAVGVIGVVIVVLIVALATGNGGLGGGKTGTTTASTPSRTAGGARKRTKTTPGARSPSTRSTGEVMSLSLKPTGVVYVCLIGDGGQKLIPGVDLQPGQSTPTYHARHFEITLGNNQVAMYLDGIPRAIPASTRAIGYSITKARGRQPLAPARQPTCA